MAQDPAAVEALVAWNIMILDPLGPRAHRMMVEHPGLVARRGGTLLAGTAATVALVVEPTVVVLGLKATAMGGLGLLVVQAGTTESMPILIRLSIPLFSWALGVEAAVVVAVVSAAAPRRMTTVAEVAAVVAEPSAAAWCAYMPAR
jgi:hypothetical protein